MEVEVAEDLVVAPPGAAAFSLGRDLIPEKRSSQVLSAVNEKRESISTFDQVIFRETFLPNR